MCDLVTLVYFFSIHKHKFPVIPSSLNIDVLPFKWPKAKSVCHDMENFNQRLWMFEWPFNLYRYTNVISHPCEGSAYLSRRGEWWCPCQFPSSINTHPGGAGVPTSRGLQHNHSLLSPPQLHAPPLCLPHGTQVRQPEGLYKGEGNYLIPQPKKLWI